MNADVANVVWSPLVPWEFLAALGVLAGLILLYGAFRRARGMVWRVLSMAVLLAALFNPSLVYEEREPRSDIAVIVVDDSPSQQIGDRRQTRDAALASIERRLKDEPNLEVRVIHAGGGARDGTEDPGTRLFEAVGRALGDVPRERLAGVILLTDGQVHDADTAESLGLKAPVHTLLTGARGESDRRLVVQPGSPYAIVGKPVEIKFRVEDAPNAKGTARVAIRRDGNPARTVTVPVNGEGKAELTLNRAGPTVLEIEAEPGPDELTLDNNRAVLTLNGVRDRLKVLLVSGEPHPGERTWRTFLKSDPSVDLVHFTILRPPEKQDNTPLNELALITFPVRELFEVKLNQFDLVIFDRYRRRGVLPLSYYANIAEYVRKGGGLLLAAGPPDATSLSAFQTPLGEVLPAQPTGQVIETGYRPALTTAGKRHPVTAELSGAPEGGEKWGRWFRQIEATAKGGTVLMEGPGKRPLLVLAREGEGRVAVLLSDQIWLWARGFEGGGPEAELLRRIAHWLMKEPELEENDLRASVRGNRLEVVRRSLDTGKKSATVTAPNGKETALELTEEVAGRAVGGMPIEGPGLYRVKDKNKTAFAAAGAPNPLESSDVRTTDAKLAPVARATGGGIFWLADGQPDIRRQAAGRAMKGSGGETWLGLQANESFVVLGTRRVPLAPAFAVLALVLLPLAFGWWREGR
ncbi:MAG: hypothetical protein ACYC1L_12335 [Alphaproteobacteria bacterium]